MIDKIKDIRLNRLLKCSMYAVLSLQFIFTNQCCAQNFNGSESHSIVVDGEERTYLLHHPPSSDRSMPLVLLLHGGGGKASGIEGISGMDRVADKNGFVVAYPQGIGGVFTDGGSNLGERNPHDDVKFVRELIKDAAKQAPIDQTRVFACGFSNQAVSFWIKVNHCAATPQIVKLQHVTGDSTSTTYERFAGAGGNDVVAYIVSGGGHCWPGGIQYFPVSVIGPTTHDFSASEAIWRFFAKCN